MRCRSASACRLLIAGVALSLLTSVPAATRHVPSPEEFFGFPMGAEHQLAGWHRIVEYFEEVGRLSDRVLVEEIGRTTMDNAYIMATVSTPDTIADLPRYREMQRRLADPTLTSEEEAVQIAREGKAVLLVGVNVHSTEIGASQMASDLLYHLATDDSPLVGHILRNVIFLLIPSQNPDGQQMVVDWYRSNLGTPYEDSPLPELYHRYVGHDNNRDSYMLTQVETQHLARVKYREWLPEVYLDKHQMGSNRARIFVPPFKNPPNPNVDPLVWAQVNLLGQAMAAKLHEHGKPGVIWGEQYTGFWQGASSANPWWHNMVGLLTETASARLATTLHQELADPEAERHRIWNQFTSGLSATRHDPTAPIPAPSDTQYRMNYPDPWLGGSWSLADVVEYQYLSTMGLLEAVANNREMLKRNFYVMNRRAIDRYRHGRPYAFVVPPWQHDPIAAAKLLQLVQAGGGEVDLAVAPFVADHVEYPAGTHVVRLAQPFGRWVKDLLEPQQYPDIRWPHPSAPLDRPYDVTAWSLGMLMGVGAVQIDQPFDAELRRYTTGVRPPPGRLSGSGPVYVIPHEINHSVIAMNRLFEQGARIEWAREPMTVNGRRFGPGAILVRNVQPGTVESLARDLHLPIEATAVPGDLDVLPVRAPRVAIFEPWGGNMDAGWTRWLLEQHEFPFERVRHTDLRQPDLYERYDVVVFADMSSAQILRGLQGRNIRPEHRGGIGDEGVGALREFVRRGGTVVTLGNAAQFAIDYLGVPFENAVAGLDPERFFCPGSILRVSVDTRHPIGYGLPDEIDAMFIHNGGYVPSSHAPSVSTAIVAGYPNGPLLRSGWIIGEQHLAGTAAVIDVGIGRGRIIMHTFRVQNRGQTWGTFKLLFNSLYYGPASLGRPAVELTEAGMAHP